jgi:hypothetical protein
MPTATPDPTADLTNFFQRIEARRANNATVDRPPAVITSDTVTLGGASGLGSPPSAPAASAPSLENTVNAGHYSFQIVDATEPNGSPQVLIYDGLVNDELPSGMGADNYIVPATDGMGVYLGITYDTDTFEINSRWVETTDNGNPPEDDQFGKFYHKLGDVAVATDSSGNVTVTPSNSQCGDLNFKMMVGAVNGAPAVIPVPVLSSEWAVLPDE